MSDGNRPKVGPPIIHIHTPESGQDDQETDKIDGATGKLGHRDVQSHPAASPVVRRSKERLSQGGSASRRTALIDGRPSSQLAAQELITPLSDDDGISSGASDTEAKVLKQADVEILQKMLSRALNDETLTVEQIKRYAEQLNHDIGHFKKVCSGVKKRLHKREHVEDEVKKVILEQSDKIVKYCNTLEGKLSKVQKAAKKGHTALQLSAGVSGLDYKGDDLSIPKSGASGMSLLDSADIICDGYKQLLAMSRLWKMEWPAFEILTGIAASFAGVPIQHQDDTLPDIQGGDNLPEEIVAGCSAIVARLNELESLANQLQELADTSSKASPTTGVSELLGTIYPDQDSALEPMPMDYFYQMGGKYAQKNHPMDLFEKRLRRVRGEILSLRKDMDLVLEAVKKGKSRFQNQDGKAVDLTSEHARIAAEMEKLDTQWDASYPSVQRLYTERENTRKKRRR